MCDCLVALPAATGSSVTRFAKNSDRPPDEAQRLEWFPPRVDGGPIETTYIDVEPARRETIGVLGSRPWWMWGFEHGVNDAGVVIGNEAIFTTLDPHSAPPALTGMDLVRLALERAPTAKEAVEVMVELLERYGQGGSGHYGVDDPYWSSFLVADAADAWVLETSGKEWASEHVARSRAISNRTTIPAFDAAFRDPAMATEAVTDPRLRASQTLLAAEPVTVAALKTHLRDHTHGEGGFSVCMHVPGFSATTAAMVVELPGPFAGGRPLAHVCQGSPCASIFVPVAVGRALGTPPDWERFAALGAGAPDRAVQRSAALDELEFELAMRAPSEADTDTWAPAAWRRVASVLEAAGV